MERMKDVKHRKNHLVKVVQRTHELCERSQALMNRVSLQLHYSTRLLRDGQELLRHAPHRTAPDLSPPNRE
jgi:hypothetical protein